MFRHLKNLLSDHPMWVSLGVLLLVIAFWEWVPKAFSVPAYIIPSASAVGQEFVRAFQTERLTYHTLMTAWQVVVGFVLGSLLGMAGGYLLGLSRAIEVVLSPYILVLQIAPKVAFAPLFVMWFGFTVYPKILVAVLIVFFPVLVNVLSAMRTVDPQAINLARSFNATRAQVFWKIEFPASLPSLFAGLRIGSTLAVIGVVVGELVGGNFGLGFLLTFGEGQANTALVFVAIIMLSLIGIATYMAVDMAERRVLHYLLNQST